MTSVGLDIEGVTAFKWSLKSLLLAPLGVLPILFGFFSPQNYRKYGFLKQANSLSALFGDYLLVYGKKTKGP